MFSTQIASQSRIKSVPGGKRRDMISARQITSAGLTLIGVSLANITATAQQAAPAFTRVVLFGDSLSDTGNVRKRTNSKTNAVVDYRSDTGTYDMGRVP